MKNSDIQFFPIGGIIIRTFDSEKFKIIRYLDDNTQNFEVEKIRDGSKCVWNQKEVLWSFITGRRQWEKFELDLSMIALKIFGLRKLFKD